jgi:hypothetical protein
LDLFLEAVLPDVKVVAGSHPADPLARFSGPIMASHCQIKEKPVLQQLDPDSGKGLSEKLAKMTSTDHRVSQPYP